MFTFQDTFYVSLPLPNSPVWESAHLPHSEKHVANGSSFAVATTVFCSATSDARKQLLGTMITFIFFKSAREASPVWVERRVDGS